MLDIVARDIILHTLKQHVGAKTMDISNIEKVYNGKMGCMCGCNGKYTYNEGCARDKYDTENVRSVKIMAKKILNHPDVKFDSDSEFRWAWVEDKKRNKNMVVYFKS